MQLPSKFILEAQTLTSSEFGGKRSKTRGGRIIRSESTGHRIAFNLVTQDLNVRTEIPLLEAFLDELGYNGVFTAWLPIYSEPFGNPTGTPQVKTAVEAGSKTVVLKGFSPNTENVTMPGDYLTFAGHTKAYKVKVKMTGADFNATQYNANGNGDVTIQLTKPLLSPLAANEAVDFSPLFTLIPDSDEWESQIDSARSGMFTSLKLPCEEFY